MDKTQNTILDLARDHGLIRYKIGLDVDLAALRESLRTNGQRRRATMHDLWALRPALPGRQRDGTL